MKTALIVLICIVSVLIVYLISCLIIFFVFHRKLFGSRCYDPDNPLYIRYEDYDFMTREEYETGFEGKKIKGFLYQNKDKNVPARAFVILSHGMFGTHIQYLFDIAMLIKNGYQVLAYDQYGIGISEGKSQVALEQGIYTLETVIDDVKKRNLNHDLPLVLYGHSWGGYCVTGAIKNYPEIKAVVARSGPIGSNKQVSPMMSRFVSPFLAAYTKPAIPLCELLILHPRYMIKATRGPKKNKETPILVIHALNDNMVPYKDASLAYYYKNHPQDNVEVFITENGSHNSLIEPESMKAYLKRLSMYNSILKMDDKTEKTLELDKFMSQLDRVNSIVYRKEVEEKILSFLDQNLKA